MGAQYEGENLLNLEGISSDLFESDEQFAAFQDQSTPVAVREKIAKTAFSNFTVQRGGELEERMRHMNYMPEYLFEKDQRRAYWQPFFQGDAFRGNKNALLRRATEVVYENTLAELQAQYGDQCPQLFTMHPAELLQENTLQTNITPFVTSSLRVVRRLVPQLLYKSLFNVVPVSQPDTKIPFEKRIYDETIVGGATSGDEIHPYSGSTWDPYYAGARVYGEAVGTGDGGTTVFDLGRGNAVEASLEVYVDGTLTSVTFGDGTGTGGLDAITFAVAPTLGQVITANYDVTSEATAGKKIRLQMDLLNVSGEILKLTHIWSLEAEQDARAYYRLNMLARNPEMLSQEIYQTIDAVTMLQVLNEATGGTAVFDSAGYLPGDNTSTAQKDYERRLYESMVAVSQDLFETHRMWPTYFVCGVGIGERLMNLEQFTAAPQAGSGMESHSRMQIQQRVLLGTIGNRWKVYQNPKLPANQGFFGWPAASPFRSNYVVTMFIPFFITPRIWNSNIDFTSGQGAMCRMGRKMIDGSQFGTLTVS